MPRQELERFLQEYGFKTASQRRKEYFLHGWFIFRAVIRFGGTLIIGYLGIGLFSLMLGFSFVASNSDPNQMYSDPDIRSFFWWAFLVVVPIIAFIVAIGGAIIDLLDP